MKYEGVADFNFKNIEALNSPEPARIIMPLLSIVMYGESFDLAVESTRRFVNHPNDSLRGVAIECVSHIARLWRKVPKDLIEEVNHAFKDQNEWVQAKADYAADDLEVFIKGLNKSRILIVSIKN